MSFTLAQVLALLRRVVPVILMVVVNCVLIPAAARASTGLVSGVRFSSLGLIIIGTQLHGNPSYLGPAIVFALVDTIVAIFVAVEIGRRVRTSASGSKPAACRDGDKAATPASHRPAARGRLQATGRRPASRA